MQRYSSTHFITFNFPKGVHIGAMVQPLYVNKVLKVKGCYTIVLY